MSKERELLERALSEMDDVIIEDLHDWGLPDEIRDFLSTPEPTQDEEPVAWISHNGFRFNADIEPIEHGLEVPLYLHPAPRSEFVRLSEEEIGALANSGLSPDWTDEFELYHFARAIEDALEEKNK